MTLAKSPILNSILVGGRVCDLTVFTYTEGLVNWRRRS
jgi:hypothetical protein